MTYVRAGVRAGAGWRIESDGGKGGGTIIYLISRPKKSGEQSASCRGALHTCEGAAHQGRSRRVMACEKDEEGLGEGVGWGQMYNSVDYEPTLCLHLRVRHIKGQRSNRLWVKMDLGKSSFWLSGLF